MKKSFILCLLVIVTCSISSSGYSAALMTKSSGKKAPPMSTEDDGYRAEADPLPEWLYLPNEVHEDSLSFTGDQNTTLTMQQPGPTGWKIETKRNGANITYTYTENNKPQFHIKTTKKYSKFKAYLVKKNGKLKASKTIDAESYFDESVPLSFERDTPEKNRFGFSLFETAHAQTENVYQYNQANKKRVPAKLTKRQINKLNHKVGFKGSDASIANKVAWYESGGGRTKAVACENNTATGFNPPYGGIRGVKYCKSKGASAGRGLYQISSHWHPKCGNTCAFTPEKNARYAYKLRKQGGWTQWCSYGGCGSNDPNPAGRGPAMQ
jgi:Lysozyme like domain